MFGWVSKAEYEAVKAQQAGAEESGRRHAAAASTMIDQAVEYATQLSKELAEAKRENRLLIDRIVQMSGQPALFDKTPPAPPPQPAPAPVPVSTLPGPAARASFDDVHNAARAAIKDGSFGMKGRVN